MDISQISTLDTATCTILHPATGEETDVKIKVFGADSRKFRELAQANARERVKAKQEGKEIPDTIEKDAEFLADLTVGWENVELAGKVLEFNRANAIKVYTLSAPIRNQVNHFITRAVNFLPKA